MPKATPRCDDPGAGTPFEFNLHALLTLRAEAGENTYKGETVLDGHAVEACLRDGLGVAPHMILHPKGVRFIREASSLLEETKERVSVKLYVTSDDICCEGMLSSTKADCRNTWAFGTSVGGSAAMPIGNPPEACFTVDQTRIHHSQYTMKYKKAEWEESGDTAGIYEVVNDEINPFYTFVVSHLAALDVHHPRHEQEKIEHFPVCSEGISAKTDDPDPVHNVVYLPIEVAEKCRDYLAKNIPSAVIPSLAIRATLQGSHSKFGSSVSLRLVFQLHGCLKDPAHK